MKWDEMTARERDALVATEIMGRAPEIIYIATADGGESACATTGNPLWRTEGDLREWLDRQKAKGHHLEYEIGTWERYPHYSTDIACAWEVVEKMRSEHPNGEILLTYNDDCLRAWFAAFYKEWTKGEDDELGRACGDTIPLAICLAALRAKGVDL